MTIIVKRRIFRAGSWGVLKRVIKPIPIIGSVFALGLVVYEIRRKGLFPGALHVGLDVTPVVGTAKNVLEIFTGDLIPDKPPKISREAQTQQSPTQLNSPQTETGGRAVNGRAA